MSYRDPDTRLGPERSGSAHGDLLQAQLLLAAVGFAATEDLQRHDLAVAADIFKDLKADDKRLKTDPGPGGRSSASPLTLSLNSGSSSTGQVGFGPLRRRQQEVRLMMMMEGAGLQLPAPASPEDLVDAALTEAVSTLGLARVTQDQLAVQTAIFGFWRFYEVVPESPEERQEARRNTWTHTAVSQTDRCAEATPPREQPTCSYLAEERVHTEARDWPSGGRTA